MKKFFILIIMCLTTVATLAQSGTNSPYSQYGLGVLSEQASGFNRGMNGVGVGFRDGKQVNFLNPASYSATDSLTFIFDAGVSAQITNFKEGNRKVNANNADFEYAVAAFRLVKHVGMSFGLLPYTNIGYNYNTTQYIGDLRTTTYTNQYSGEGGLHEAYLGMGWEPFKGVSIGVNGGYLWGNYTRRVLNTYSETTANTITKLYSADVRSYKVDFGLQLTAHVARQDWLTLGATYGLGHKIGGKPQCQVISNNALTSVADTATYPRNGEIELEIPATMAVGVMWNHADRLKIGFDYSLQKWADVQYPEYVESGGAADYKLKDNLFKDRHKYALGFDYCPQVASKRLLRRIHYRGGVAYASPYFIINGQDGPKEMSASLGLGIPIMNSWNNRSTLNISAQWVRQEAKSLITENTFRINIGLTFNEAWFMKWKLE